ncbi:hypothetical protein ACFPIJ_58920 [Dactylosporangium cerinum]|uniref:Secreted protein n=1 Tax=Dactylosporangium cerinum TaxID=1434730 RepID=A0ABV9WHV8_9ACTN
MASTDLWLVETAPAGQPGGEPAGRHHPHRRVDWARTAPGRLTMILLVIVALGGATGLAQFLAWSQRSALVHGMATGSSPLGLSALDIYRSLSDADATVASDFLIGGTGDPELRRRYLYDVVKAAEAINVAAGAVDGGSAAAQELATLNIHLPMYTGLVESARAISRQGHSLGAAYLRESSALMRNTLLPAAQRLYDTDKGGLASAQRRASAVPWVVVLMILGTIGALVLASRRLARMTKRRLNGGLLAATAAAVACLAVTVAATVTARDNLEEGRRHGSEDVQILAEARTAALQARADEALTLVARGGGRDFEEHYQAAMARLDGLLAQAEADVSDAALQRTVRIVRQQVRTWAGLHKKIRELDDRGQYTDAVKLATSQDAGGITIAYLRLHDALDREIAQRNTTFTDTAEQARRVIVWWGAGALALTLILLLGAALGLQRRIAEYR